jgi:hypothetical protein
MGILLTVNDPASRTDMGAAASSHTKKCAEDPLPRLCAIPSPLSCSGCPLKLLLADHRIAQPFARWRRRRFFSPSSGSSCLIRRALRGAMQPTDPARHPLRWCAVERLTSHSQPRSLACRTRHPSAAIARPSTRWSIVRLGEGNFPLACGRTGNATYWTIPQPVRPPATSKCKILALVPQSFWITGNLGALARMMR